MQQSRAAFPSPACVCAASELAKDVQSLLSRELNESAAIMGSFMLSLNQQTRELDQTECIALYADALKATKEYKRAVMYYRQALNLRQRHEGKQEMHSRPVPVVGHGAAPAPIASMAPDQEGCRKRARSRATFRESEAMIAYKVALCYQELRDWEAAVKELEAIPVRLRSATVYNLLGRLYRHMSHTGKSVDAFKECLRRMPLAIDAAIALVELGVTYNAVIDLCPVMAKSNLSQARTTTDCKHTNPAPRSAEAALCGRLASSQAPENCVRLSSHPGHLCHSAPMEMNGYGAINVRDPTAFKISSATPPTVPPAVRMRQVAECLAASDGLSSREPMVERALSPTDAWLSRQKEQQAWQPAEVAQHDHMQDAEQLHPAGVLLAPAPQQRPACTHLSLKGGLPAVQQSAQVCSDPFSIRSGKRRKVVAVRLPLLEQEQEPQNSGAARDVVHTGTKRDQPDSHMAPIDAPLEDKTSKPATLSMRVRSTQVHAPAGANYPSAAVPVHAVSQIKEAEKREMLQRQGLGWLGLVVAGHAHLFRAANREAVREFSAAAALFPNDITSMLSAAVALLAAGDQVGAVSTFQRARVLDPLNVRGMDAYACLLLDQGNHEELRMLSHGLLAVDQEMPEVWAVMAYFWLQKSESDKALEYVERGLKQGRDHIGLRLAKGRCLLHKQEGDAALAEFRAILRCRSHDVIAYSGAVRACLRLRRYQEAMLHARAAVRALPQHAVAEYLLGCVYVQTPAASQEEKDRHRQRALRHMRRALDFNPAHREAALAVVELLEQRADWDDAAAVLKQQLALCPEPALHVRLGQVYRAAQRLNEAADEYSAALGLNAADKDAAEMLEEISATQVETTRHERDDGEADNVQLEDAAPAQAQHGITGDDSERIWTADVDMDS
eukprot:jgi/Ulvmu1/4329/UM002_0052.1